MNVFDMETIVANILYAPLFHKHKWYREQHLDNLTESLFRCSICQKRIIRENWFGEKK